MPQKQYDVLIVGGGIMGCAIAYYTARAGLHVVLIEKGRLSGEASQAAGGMLAPLDLSASGEDQSLQHLYLASLQCYQGLNQALKQETDLDIGLREAPTLYVTFEQSDIPVFRQAFERQQNLFPGLQWLDGEQAKSTEPLLSEAVQAAILSPVEWNVMPKALTSAFAQGAALCGASMVENCPTGYLIRQGTRIVGVETPYGPWYAKNVVLAAGAWTSQWHIATSSPPIFPVKGQMLALQAPFGLDVRHTIHVPHLGGIIPKADGSLLVGATSEPALFDKYVTTEGMAFLLSVATKLVPQLKSARFERAWAGLRPAALDGRPLIGPSQTAPGLWIASGHFRDGILLGPITGQIISEMIQGRSVPFALDIQPFDPDRFGGWESFQR